MNKLGLLLAATALTFSPLLAERSYSGQDQDLENSKTNTDLIIAEIRPKVFNELPPAEQAIYDQIKFNVSSDDRTINAYATRRGGVRWVTFTEAMGRAIKLNTDALLMEQLYHKPRFLGDYMAFVCERYQQNYKRYAQGLEPARIPSPYDFAHWTDADLNEFYSDADVNKARATIVGGAFAFFLAHEVAHHILGHVDHPASDLGERRQQETEADTWAIDLLVRKKISPVDGAIPLLFFYYTDQHPVSREGLSDHPADSRRLLNMYQGLEDRLPTLKSYLLSSGQDYDTVLKQVQAGKALVTEEISEGH